MENENTNNTKNITIAKQTWKKLQQKKIDEDLMNMTNTIEKLFIEANKQPKKRGEKK